MTQIFLVLIFLVGGEPTVVEGLLPRPADNRSQCRERLDTARNYFREQHPEMTLLESDCVRADNPAHAVQLLMEKGFRL